MLFQICHTSSSVSNSYHRMSKRNDCGSCNTFWVATFIIILSVICKWIQLWKLLHWELWRSLLSVQKIISNSVFSTCKSTCANFWIIWKTSNHTEHIQSMSTWARVHRKIKRITQNCSHPQAFEKTYLERVRQPKSLYWVRSYTGKFGQL